MSTVKTPPALMRLGENKPPCSPVKPSSVPLKPPPVFKPEVLTDQQNRHTVEQQCKVSRNQPLKPPEVLTPATAPASSLAAVLPADDDSKEVSLGTVASLQVHAASAPRLADRLAEKQAKTFCPTESERGQNRKASGGNQTEGCIKGESAAAVPPDALQGVPLSDQEREDIAAGLTPAMARRASEARVYTLEWLLGLERMTQEQAESVASFRKMDAALISARGKIPYLDTLGIPRFPPDCEPKYRHWEGGQPLLDTLLELRAQDWAIDSRVTREGSPDDWQRWQEIKAKRRT